MCLLINIYSVFNYINHVMYYGMSHECDIY